MLETVTVDNGDGDVIAGADIFSSNPDGSLFATAKSDASGKASIDVPPGGSVSSILTRVDPGGSSTALKLHMLYTLVDVEQGSSVRLLSFQEGPDKPQAPEMGDITLALANLPAGTQDVRLLLPCISFTQSASDPIVVSHYQACHGESSYDVVALALDANGDVLGSAFVLEKPFKAGVATSHTLSFSSNVVNTTASIEALPPGTDYASLRVTGRRSQRPDMAIWMQREFSDPAAASVSASFGQPGDLPLTFVVQEEAHWQQAELSYTSIRSTPFAQLPPTSTWTLPSALAQVAGLGAPDLQDIARPKFKWQLTGGSLGQCVMLTTQAKHSDSEHMMWTVAAKATENGSYQLPELPEAYADATLALGDVVSSVEVVHVNAPSAAQLDHCIDAASYGDSDQAVTLNSATWGSPLK